MLKFKLSCGLVMLPLLVACHSVPDTPPPPGTITGATALIVPSPGVFPSPRPQPTPVSPSVALSTSKAFSSILAGGNSGSRDGVGEAAQFSSIKAMVLDLDGNILVADAGANAIRKVTLVGEVTTIAGTGGYGKADGRGQEATFRSPSGIAVDADGAMYVADTGNSRLRKISSNGDVLTLTRTRGWYASPDDGLQYDIKAPKSVVAAKNGELFVTDSNDHIYRVTPDGQIAVYFDGHGTLKDGTYIERIWFKPGMLVLDPDNHLLFADEGNVCVWRIPTNKVAERIIGTTFTGQGFLDGDRSVAAIGEVKGMAYDTDGNLYFNDASKPSVRVLSKDGRVTTIIGDGIHGNILGVATEARLGRLEGLVVGRDRNLYVADAGNRRIIKIALQ